MERIMFMIGTRPEAIKLCPLILELQRRKKYTVSVCSTGQHREMLDSVLQVFDLKLTMTWWSAIFSTTVVIFPLMYRTARGAFESFDETLAYSAQTLGLSNTYIFWRIRMPCCKQGILAGTVLSFADTFSDFSKFSKMSFYVRNDGTEALKLEGVRFKMAFAALDASSDCADGMIPADGQWHRIVLNLNDLEDFIGNKFDRSYLSATSKIQFLFEGTADGTLLMDQVEWLI